MMIELQNDETKDFQHLFTHFFFFSCDNGKLPSSGFNCRKILFGFGPAS